MVRGTTLRHDLVRTDCEFSTRTLTQRNSLEIGAVDLALFYILKLFVIFEVLHGEPQKGHPFYFENNLSKCWPNCTIFGKNVAEKICNIFVLCCSPHLFSVVTLPQENKVPFNYACTCESVLLTGAIVLMIKTYRLNKTIQIHSAYVSVITCVRSVPFGRYTTVKVEAPIGWSVVCNATARNWRDHWRVA